jgi:hypothetical protein
MSNSNVIRKKRWAGNVARITEKINRILVGRCEERRPLGKSGCRWDNNITMDIKEFACDTCTGLMCLRICNAPL